jgi:hypothetical protein
MAWALDRNLDDELTLTTLRMALANRKPLPGLVYHSDRGSQYASGDYIGNSPVSLSTIAMLCCPAWRSQPTIFISASFVPSLLVG